VLVVEDSLVSQTAARMLLERLGCRVEVASNGEEAVALVARGQYDLVLMDCELPVMDGYTAAGQIRRLAGAAAATPIVALTASDRRDEAERCARAGMDDHIGKPVTLHALASVVGRHAGTPGARGAGAPLADLRAKLGRTADVKLPELVDIFTTETPETIAALERAIASGDAAGVRRAVHGLKGSAGFIGAVRLRDICAAIEEAGGVEAAAARLDELRGEAERVCAELRAAVQR
jgi:CheY-like chemotaxis protein